MTSSIPPAPLPLPSTQRASWVNRSCHHPSIPFLFNCLLQFPPTFSPCFVAFPPSSLWSIPAHSSTNSLPVPPVLPVLPRQSPAVLPLVRLLPLASLLLPVPSPLFLLTCKTPPSACTPPRVNPLPLSLSIARGSTWEKNSVSPCGQFGPFFLLCFGPFFPPFFLLLFTFILFWHAVERHGTFQKNILLHSSSGQNPHL